MIDYINMALGPLAIIAILAGLVYMLGRPLMARYLAESDDPLAQANQDLQRRPRLGAHRGLR